MARLINADTLIEDLEEMSFDFGNDSDDTETIIEMVREVINKQPTFYDIKKTLKQLKEAETDVSNLGDYAIYTDDAIKIVLKGGV